MDVAGLSVSPERDTLSSDTPTSADIGDQRVRAESPRPGQGSARLAPVLERSGALAAVAPDTADELQADYFVRLLDGQRSFIDQRIGEYQRKIVAAEARGDVEAVSNFWQLVRVADQDREAVDALIEKLCRRFARPVPVEVTSSRMTRVRTR